MKYGVRNPVTGEMTEFDTATSATAYDDAVNLLKTVQQSFLEREAGRFTINKVIVVGTDSTWLHVDLANDPEDGEYLVFKQYEGTYQPFTKLSEAVAFNEQLKSEFITEVGLDKPIEIPEPVANTSNTTVSSSNTSNTTTTTA